MELTYYRKGDYLYPNLILESEDNCSIGKYGLLRESFLKSHKPDLYRSLRLTGKLSQHLAQIEAEAQSQVDRIVNELLNNNPAPDKETDQLLWVAHMNNIVAQAEEIVCNTLICC